MEQQRMAQQRRMAEQQQMAQQQQMMQQSVAHSSMLVKDVQRSLLILGYITGPIDGIYDSVLAKAIMTYQSDHGIADTGAANAALLNHLRANRG